VEAANPNEQCKPGANVQISVDAGEVPDAIVVPVSALLNGEGGAEKVMLAGTDGLAHEQEVKVGIRNPDVVQIAEGVKAGDRVITDGALGLDDKAKIQIGAPAKEKD
jgi:multidrug efflux pump subunit AcrA (membrane-fusion protein)